MKKTKKEKKVKDVKKAKDVSAEMISGGTRPPKEPPE
jgi:hypothetical protein